MTRARPSIGPFEHSKKSVMRRAELTGGRKRALSRGTSLSPLFSEDAVGRVIERRLISAVQAAPVSSIHTHIHAIQGNDLLILTEIVTCVRQLRPIY